MLVTSSAPGWLYPQRRNSNHPLPTDRYFGVAKANGSTASAPAVRRADVAQVNVHPVSVSRSINRIGPVTDDTSGTSHESTSPATLNAELAAETGG